MYKNACIEPCGMGELGSEVCRAIPPSSGHPYQLSGCKRSKIRLKLKLHLLHLPEFPKTGLGNGYGGNIPKLV